MKLGFRQIIINSAKFVVIYIFCNFLTLIIFMFASYLFGAERDPQWMLKNARQNMEESFSRKYLRKKYSLDCTYDEDDDQDLRDVTCTVMQGRTVVARTTYLYGTDGGLYGHQEWSLGAKE